MIDLQVGHRRTARVGPWRASTDVATIATYLDQPLDVAAVGACLEELRRRGFRRVITAALDPREVPAFSPHGFTPIRRLVLLHRTIDDPIARADRPLRRIRRRNLDDVLDVDRVAFEPFWQFDRLALLEALGATPQRLLRATPDDPISGYALTGLAGQRGYLQRLAVRPDVAGRGTGSALLLDALRWLRARGATGVYVNTQDDNARALDLYLRHGFVAVPGGLTMLEADIEPAPRSGGEPSGRSGDDPGTLTQL